MPDAAAQQLAETYAPITMLREQQEPPCETSAEQYQPTSVDTVLGNPTVTLTHDVPDEGAGRGRDRRRPRPTSPASPTATTSTSTARRSATPASTPGTSRSWSRKARRRRSPTPTSPANRTTPASSSSTGSSGTSTSSTTSTRATGRGCSSASKPKRRPQALREEPQRNHPLPARRRRARRLGRREGAEGRHAPDRLPGGRLARDLLRLRRLRRERPARLRGRLRQHHRAAARTAAAPGPPARTTPPNSGAFEWLSYDGRWGEREKGFNNGPTGPTTKTVWKEPFTWMAEQRTTSPRLPGGSIVGPQVTGAFCGAVAAASDLINLEAKSRPLAIATIVVVVAPDRALRRPHPLGPGRPRASCGRGAPSASWSAPRASSTAATGWSWSRSA